MTGAGFEIATIELEIGAPLLDQKGCLTVEPAVMVTGQAAWVGCQAASDMLR